MIEFFHKGVSHDGRSTIQRECRFLELPILITEARLGWIHENLHAYHGCVSLGPPKPMEFSLLDPQEEISTADAIEACDLVTSVAADIWALFAFARVTPLGQADKVVALGTIHEGRFAPYLDEYEGLRKIYFERRDYPWPKGFRFLAVK